MPQLIRDRWLGRENKLTIKGGVLRKGPKILNVDKKAVARLQLENDALRRRVDELLAKLEAKDTELEHWKGRKLNKGPALTLEQAKDKFLKSFTGRSGDTLTQVEGICTPRE